MTPTSATTSHFVTTDSKTSLRLSNTSQVGSIHQHCIVNYVPFLDIYRLDTNFDLWKAFTLSYLIWFLGFSVYWILMELWGSFPVFHQRGSRISNSNCWKMSYWCKLSGRLRWCVNFLMCLDSNPIWHFKKAAFTEVSRKCITFAIWRIWSFYKRAVFWLNEINM